MVNISSQDVLCVVTKTNDIYKFPIIYGFDKSFTYHTNTYSIFIKLDTYFGITKVENSRYIQNKKKRFLWNSWTGYSLLVPRG